MKETFDKEELIKHWIESSDMDFKTMMDLYNTKNNSWALFIGHLVIEKLLKALYVNNISEYPPLIHDLRRLCEKAGVEIDGTMEFNLDTITRFNIKARYDDYKQSFYKLSTDDFTSEWIDKIKDCRIWIKTKL